MVTDGSWFCFVVEDDNSELVAFAKGTPHDGGVPGLAGELNKIYALLRVHRQGIAALLKGGVVQFAAEAAMPLEHVALRSRGIQPEPPRPSRCDSWRCHSRIVPDGCDRRGHRESAAVATRPRY